VERNRRRVDGSSTEGLYRLAAAADGGGFGVYSCLSLANYFERLIRSSLSVICDQQLFVLN